MKYIKIFSVAVSLFIITNVVTAQSQRMLANTNANIEVRSTEDVVSDPSAFVSINPSDNAREMSSKALRVKSKKVAAKTIGFVQSQSNKKDVVKKYNRFDNEQGEKKDKKEK